MYCVEGLSSGALINLRLDFERDVFSTCSFFLVKASLDMSFARSSGSLRFNLDEHEQKHPSLVLLFFVVANVEIVVKLLMSWSVVALPEENGFSDARGLSTFD